MNGLKEKINTNFKKNKKYILAFLLIWVVVVSATLYLYKDTLGKESYGNSVYDNVSYFYDNEIIQKVNTVDGSKTISLFLSIQEKNGSSVNVKVVGNDSNTLYGEKNIKDRYVLNDSYNAIVLDTPLDKSKDKTISIIMTSNNETHNNLGVWYSEVSPFGENTLSINGDIIEGNITAKFLLKNSEFQFFNNIIVSVVGVGGLIIILYMFLLEPKKECLFAIMVLYLGIIYMMIITPFSGPDEDYHYKQTLILSNEILGKENVLEIEDTYLDYDGFTSHTNNGKGYKRIIDSLNDPLDDLSERSIVPIERSTVYSYELCYVPEALGVTIARLCKFNYLNTYYMGRFFNLLFYTLCVFISVKNTPILKNAFGIVSLFPIFVQQSITYTTDSWICALSMGIFAFFLKWMFADEKISTKEFIVVLIMDLLLAPAKYVYSLLAVIFFVIPKNRFGKKEKIIIVLLLLIPTIYVIGKNVYYRIAPIIMKPEVTNDSGEVIEKTEEVVEQILTYNDNFSVRYALLNPLKTINIVINTIKVRAKTWVCTAVGRALSGGTLLIPLEIVYGFMAVAIMAALQKENNILSIGNKVLIVIVCLMIAGLVLASMLVGWTKYNDVIIQGVQGRYFSPMIIYLLAVINNKKIHVPQNIDKYLILIDLILSFETIISVLSFTFVN